MRFVTERNSKKMKDEKRNGTSPELVKGLIYRITGTSPKKVFTVCLYCICGYLFAGAETVLETYPMGIAFMCSVNTHIPFAALGVVISALVRGNAAAEICGCFISLAFRCSLHCIMVDKSRIFLYNARDSVLSKVCSACAGSLCISLIRIISGGFTYYDLLSGIFSVGCGGFMVYVYSLVTDRKNRYTQRYEAGVAAVLFTATLALKYVEIFGLSCGAICAFLFSVYVSRKGGALRGALTGFLCGAALDISLCPVFGIVGFLCGFPLFHASLWTVGISITCAGVFGAYTLGIEEMLVYLPEAIAACAIYIPTEKFALLPDLRIFKDDIMYKNAVSVREIANIRKSSMYHNGYDSLSKTLSDISDVICALSDRERRPAVHEICELCEKEFETFCKKCSMKKLCFPKGIRSDVNVRRTAGAIYDKGALSTEDLPEKIRTGCYFADKLTVSINVKLSSYISEKLRHNKTEVMAEDYMRISDLIQCAVEKTHKENELNKELTEKLQKHNIYRDLFGSNIAVYGEERLTVIACGLDMRKISSQSSELKKTFGKILGVQLDEPEITVIDEYLSVILQQSNRFSCEEFSVQYAKDGEIINGDSIFTSENDGKFCACICDGMGSGSKAALTSKLACVFLERLLLAGCNISPVLKMLNHFVRCKTDECFTTVDLSYVDLRTGLGSFIKSGASVSLVVRQGRIFRIASHTPPVGIMKELCSEKIEFAFKNGDIAVMMSDGVSDCENELLWLYDMLSEYTCESCEELCKRIADTAKERSGGSDDITVCVYKISLT